MRCLFCPFDGTKDELVVHSGSCRSHPLWQLAVYYRAKLLEIRPKEDEVDHSAQCYCQFCEDNRLAGKIDRILDEAPDGGGGTGWGQGRKTRYYLRLDIRGAIEHEVTKEQWVQAERVAGFSPGQWAGWDEPCTGGFGAHGVCGRIETRPDEAETDD